MSRDEITLFDYLDSHLVTFLQSDSQEEALHSLIDLLDSEEKLSNKKAFFQAIMSREKIVSTGIGIGVAIPHAKLEGYTDFFVGIGIQKDKGIEWGAIDDLPVQIIFIIGGPEDQQTEYLKILSMITGAIKDVERRKQLLEASNVKQVMAVFKDL